MNGVRLLRTVLNLLIFHRYPVGFVHFVTTRCNARCPHCFIDFGTGNEHASSVTTFNGRSDSHGNELSLSEIEVLTKHLGPCLENANLTGGEPFLREDLGDIARLYFRNGGVRSLYVTTNGSLPERILKFAESMAKGFPDRSLLFQLSIDDFPKAHDTYRGIAGLFDKVLLSYRGLSQLGSSVTPTIGITVNEANYDTVMALYRHLTQDCGVRSVTAWACRTSGVHRVPELVRSKVVRATLTLNDQIETDIQRGLLDGFGKERILGRLLNAKNTIQRAIMSDSLLKPRYVLPCTAGALFGVLGPEGTVYACEVLDEKGKMGNLRDYEMDLKRLWRWETAAAVRTMIRASNCFCDNYCVMTYNIMANWRFRNRALLTVLRQGIS